MEAATLSMCAVPLVVGDRTIGALRFSFPTRKLFDEDERAFVLALAAQTAVTLQRTELYEAEREASLELQRALLPGELASIRGWDLAAYYSPAGEQEAGGDFYDVIPLPDGRVAAVVGDVMGRGVHAAAAMAQIRSTIRAYALDDPDPASVFSRVDAFFDVLTGTQLVTVLYLLIDSDNSTVQIANAGHLQPFVVDHTGARLLTASPGLPFGVMRDDRQAASVEIVPGASIVLVPDGLVERRGEDIDEGLTRVLDLAAESADEPPRRLLDRLVAGAAAARVHDDDVTVLVLRRL
jgi:serine phosphatase RsbU (regulator of sigma subunit)